MKNIEKIKNMDTKDLAKFIKNNAKMCFCCPVAQDKRFYNNPKMCGNHKCTTVIKKWLEREAESE